MELLAVSNSLVIWPLWADRANDGMGEGNDVTENRELKITIMIPTFNQADFIGEAIQSALSQTYSNLEIIVGDDASTDTTPNIVSGFLDVRIKYIRNAANIGRTANYRNLLFKHATGDYVVNLDGDDYYTDPDFIAESVKLITGDQNVVMVAAKASWKISSNILISNIPDTEEISGLVLVRNLPDKKYYLMHMATLYARAVAVKFDFYGSNSNSSDWESLYRLSLRGKTKYLDRSVGIWRIHGDNESMTTDCEKLFLNLAIWPSIYDDAINYGLSPMQAKMICAKCIACFASSFGANISLNGNADLVKFLAGVWRRYKLASLVLGLTPKYAARIVFSLLGYYRLRRLR